MFLGFIFYVKFTYKVSLFSDKNIIMISPKTKRKMVIQNITFFVYLSIILFQKESHRALI